MLNRLQRDEKGFTIIEVLIVLAIAGLIMLIVFLAIPALQRNQRNNARNSEASRIAGLATECISNRNGQTSSCDTAAEISYVASDFGQLTTVNVSTSGTAPASSTTAAGVWYGRVCSTDASSATTTGATARSFAVLFTLEPDVTRCIAG